MKKIYKELVQLAQQARLRSKAQYSNFHVGAALLGESGKIYTGCNIENSSFSLTICAERTAIFKAISEGETSFKAIAIAAEGKGFISPCGSCRQVLYELAGNIDCILIDEREKTKIISIKSLLPFAFTGDNLKQNK